jgi:hypothetical protein
VGRNANEGCHTVVCTWPMPSPLQPRSTEKRLVTGFSPVHRTFWRPFGVRFAVPATLRVWSCAFGAVRRSMVRKVKGRLKRTESDAEHTLLGVGLATGHENGGRSRSAAESTETLSVVARGGGVTAEGEGVAIISRGAGNDRIECAGNIVPMRCTDLAASGATGWSTEGS